MSKKLEPGEYDTVVKRVFLSRERVSYTVEYDIPRKQPGRRRRKKVLHLKHALKAT